MAQGKTQPTDDSVDEFLAAIDSERRRTEGQQVVEMMREVTGEDPVMWGPSIVGFGSMHYKYASGREGDWPKVGFSPRKAQLSFYGLKDTPEGEALLNDLGPHTTGAGCVYVKNLNAVNEDVLKELIDIAFRRGDYDAPRG